LRSTSAALSKGAKQQAHIFAALGDVTRLALVAKLNDGIPHSISTLSAGCKMSRQAVTKHLTVLEDVGLVSKVKEGRESLYALDPKPLHSIQEYLEIISRQWDHTLSNFAKFVEESET
jgi:DNA-binding transcriptional ArsR family regulator